MSPEEIHLAKRQLLWDRRIEERSKWLEKERKRRLQTRDKTIPEIKDFYSGKSVLVTGGTGFIGKVLIQKMLRSLPDLEKIYVIVRAKRGQSPGQRMAAIFNSDLFEATRKQCPEALNKVVPVSGDMSCKGLGFSQEDCVVLQREVSVVIHAAATVRFDDSLQKAVLLNTRGTSELLHFCKDMRHLQSFVHVSTTYCNTDQGKQLEKVYPTPYDWKQVIKLAEETSHADLEAASPKILGFQPNTYTFTKQLSEKIVDDARSNIPVIIVRPSVVTATTQEPFPGWTDNINGPIGLGVGIMKGVLRVLYMDRKVFLSYVSVDSTAAILIAAAWLRATGQRFNADSSDTDVVNVSGEDVCDATYYDLVTAAKPCAKAMNLRCLRWPRITPTTNIYYYTYQVLTSHLIFGMIMDLILKLSGQKPQLVKVYRKIYHANYALQYFMLNNFSNVTDNVWKCVSYITDPDFYPPVQFSLTGTGRVMSEYVFKNMFKEKPGSPLRTKIMETVHNIQVTVEYMLYTWLGWKISLFLYRRFLGLAT